MADHSVGTFLQRAGNGRGCSVRASAGDRAVAAQGGLASLSRDNRRLADAGRSMPAPHGRGGVGKRRLYATIFSCDSPRSRSISSERRGRHLSRAGSAPGSSSPWPLPCRPLTFTRASTVFIPAASPRMLRQYGVVHDNTHRPYGVPLEFDRNASAGLRFQGPFLCLTSARPAKRLRLYCQPPSGRSARPHG